MTAPAKRQSESERCAVPRAVLDRMRSECERAGVTVDLAALVHRAEDWATRDGSVRSAAGVFVAWVRDAIGLRRAWQREQREHLARDRARLAALWVHVLELVACRQPSPRALADELEIIERSGYPDLADVVTGLRRLGDHWPGTRASPPAGAPPPPDRRACH